MTNMNKANRTCCDVDIRVLKTLAPYLFFEDANVTTFGFTADETYATSKGACSTTIPSRSSLIQWMAQ